MADVIINGVNIEDAKKLATYAISKKVPTQFANEPNGLEAVEYALRDACRKLAPSRIEYQRNKTYIFEIIQTALDIVVPQKVLETVGQFADVQQFGLEETVRFKIKAGRNRAKQFVTRAARAGIYETFRLDHRYVDVQMNNYGGAAAIDFERYLKGHEDFADYTAIMMEAMEEAVYKEIWTALKNAAQVLRLIGDGETNYVEVEGDGETFTAEESGAIQKLITTAKRYGNGTGAIIMSTAPVLQKFTNGGGDFTPNVPQSDLEEIKRGGRIGVWKGTDLVELPNSFEDETNTTTVFEDCYGFIFPNGRDHKVVKVAMEGQTQVDDFKDRNRDYEIHAYRAFGVAILTYNDWCMFKVTSLAEED